MNQSNAVFKTAYPVDQQFYLSDSRIQSSSVMYFRRRLFCVKILMGSSIRDAGAAVGYTMRELEMVVDIPEVKKIIYPQQQSTVSSKSHYLVELYEKGTASMQDIISLDENNNIILKDRRDISPNAWSMVKNIKYKNGIVVSLSMKNGLKYLWKLERILHRLQK